MNRVSISTPVPMPCPAWIKQLAAIHPDDLTLEERAALDAHVQSCESCAAVLAEYRRMDVGILALPPVLPLQKLPAELQESPAFPSIPRAPLRPLPLLPSYRANRWARAVSVLAAVLVVGAIIGGFALLLTKHQSQIGGTGAGKVIFVASRGSDGTIYALDPSDGTMLWQYNIGQKLSGDLIASNGSVYAIAGNHAYALNENDGSLRWTSPAIQGGALPPMFSDGNAVYLSSPTAVYALSAKDGHMLWSRSSPGCSSCSAAFAAVQDGVAYAYLDGLYALNASNGTVLWHHPELQFTTPSFAVAEGKVYVPEEHAGKVAELRASDGTLLHTFTYLKDQPIEMIVSNGILYVDSGGQETYAIQVSDDSVLWQDDFRQNKRFGSFIFGLSAADESGLYFAFTTVAVDSIQPVSSSGSPIAGATPSTSSAASTQVYALNAGDGLIRWYWRPSNNPGSASNALVLNGTVYVSIGDSLYALNATNGKQLWVLTEQSPLSSPVTG